MDQWRLEAADLQVRNRDSYSETTALPEETLESSVWFFSWGGGAIL